MDNALEFSYKTDGFEDAIKLMINAYEGFTKAVDKMSAAQEKNFEQTVDRQSEKQVNALKDTEKKEKVIRESSLKKFSAWTVAKGVLIAGLVKAAAMKVWATIQQNIPEIGQTFKIAGDIMAKNLLWPLRLQLIPLLQKLLTWTKDHRADFLKYGVVIANVFKAIMVGVNVAASLLKTFAKAFSEAFNIKNLSDFINIASLKLALIFGILRAQLEPLVVAIARATAALVKDIGLIVKFLNDIGLIRGAITLLTELLNVLTDLLNLDFSSFGKGFVTYLKSLKEDTSAYLSGSSPEKQWEKMSKEYKILYEQLPKQQQALFDTKASKVKYSSEYVDLIDEMRRTLPNSHADYKGSINDGIIKPDGSIIKTDPGDTLIATKNPVTKSSMSNSYSMGEIKVNLTVTEGNAQTAGIITGRSIAQTIRAELMNSLVAGGAR
jgi:hypothetical protein